MNMLLWISIAVAVASLVLQGVVLRNSYRRKVAKQQAKMTQLEQSMAGKFDQTRRQIGQLQNDLATARRQLKQHAKSNPAAAQNTAPAKQALERELDGAPESRFSLPADGFADTQPTQHGSLLLQ
jgi:predicted  nucleic acid-binding Zn-ribbon protein